MKKIILILLAFTAFSKLIAQQVVDTVYIDQNYSNQSYYSLSNDEVANIDNSDWDLAFEAGIFGVAIRINGQIGTELYDYPNGDTADWATMDTTGITAWAQSFDSDDYWEMGAFNQGGDPSNQFDYGWGYYNPITHVVVGDSLFVLKLSNGDYKKIWIEQMNPIINNYTFKYADLDGSNEVEVVFDKNTYDGKNFGYYSIQNEEELDREPASDTWDIVFTKYVGIYSPNVYYPVVGGLINKAVLNSQADDVDVETAVWSDYTMEDTISVIGWDWKNFDLGTFSYEVAADRCYFINDVDGNIWKVIFTEFGGSSNGLIAFSKEQVGTVGIDEQNDITAFVLYPNPATNGNVTIKYNNKASSILTTITDLSGKQVFAERFFNSGEQIQQINVQDLSSGLYIISIENGTSKISKKLIIK
jgi:hypothetical protein